MQTLRECRDNPARGGWGHHPAAGVFPPDPGGVAGRGQTAFNHPTKITTIPLSGIQASAELFFPSLGPEPPH